MVAKSGCLRWCRNVGTWATLVRACISGPNEPPPVKPGHRGQLPRLIRERLVSVNLPGNVRRSELREGDAAGSTRHRRIEKPYSNHKLAGIMSFRRWRNVAAAVVSERGHLGGFAGLDPVTLRTGGLRCFFTSEWRWTRRDHKSQAADISER